jgi:CheY-like chemotaxis protein
MATVDGEARYQGKREKERTERPEARRRQLVLIVSSSATAGGAYGGLLWYNGYDVRHATDADTAVSAAAEHGPDLVLVDSDELPGPPTLDLAHRIREGSPTATVVAMVGQAVPGFEDEARAAGVHTVIEKPASHFAVVRTVMGLIGAPPPPDGAC